LVVALLVALSAGIGGCLTRKLKSPTLATRLEAVAKLEQQSGDHSRELLIGALNDEAHEVRIRAIKALVFRKERPAAPAVAELLNDSAAVIRSEAAKALASLQNTKTIPALANALGDEDPDTAAAIISALKVFGTDALPEILNRFSDERPIVRGAAVALALSYDPLPLDALTDKLEDPSSRNAAKAALTDIGEAALDALHHKALIASGDTLTVLTVILGDIASPKSLNPLARLIEHPSQPVRAAAAHALGRIGTRNAAQPLLKGLQDPDPEVRHAAAASFSMISDSRAVPMLISLLQDPQVRIPAAVALGRMGDRSAVTSLIHALDVADPEFKTAVINSLGAMQASAAVPKLIALLTAEDQAIRQAAIAALGRIDSPRAVPALKDAYRRSVSCQDRLLLRRVLEPKNRAGGLPPPEEGALDLCAVCGKCSSLLCETDNKYYCPEHQDQCRPSPNR